MNLSSTLINRLTALKSLINLGDVELVSALSSRLDEHQHEPAIQEIKAALTDHRYAEAVRMIEKLLSDTAPSFNGMRAGEERDWQIAKGVKMSFCWCPPGDFLMGSPKTEEECYANEDQVYVTLTKGFWMAKTEVTQAQWRAVMGSNPSDFKGDYLPVETVSWDAAQDFINKVNGGGEIPEGGKVCLPTEAQWEYACRAGEKGQFSGGTLDQVAWYDGNSGCKSHPVGTKKPNAWGLLDMHGNVWEWCADWYDEELLGGIDPSGASSGVFRVYRGGSWRNLAAPCRAAYRRRSYPGIRLPSLGFRPALVPSE